LAKVGDNGPMSSFPSVDNIGVCSDIERKVHFVANGFFDLGFFVFFGVVVKNVYLNAFSSSIANGCFRTLGFRSFFTRSSIDIVLSPLTLLH